ncbi:MAG: divalent-cation tolerance protein CutA [Planctomycetes bacterium]|nr:divalent-cation tolerance protein CutA [Planctomycetota bacterium]
MANLNMVYITCASPVEAEAIGRALVAERLAACVNIVPGMRSIYRWKGAIEEAHETILIAKTPSALVAALTERVKGLHSYTVPCIVALPMEAGNVEYLQWIADETAELP